MYLESPILSTVRVSLTSAPLGEFSSDPAADFPAIKRRQLNNFNDVLYFDSLQFRLSLAQKYR